MFMSDKGGDTDMTINEYKVLLIVTINGVWPYS